MKTSTPFSDRVGRETCGAAIPVLAGWAALDPAHGGGAQDVRTVTLLGTVHDRRGRWNPFLPENAMNRSGPSFVKELPLSTTGGRHGDGVYALRFVVNHDLARSFKADHQRLEADGRPRLVAGSGATQAHNIMLRVTTDGMHRITFDPEQGTFDVSPRPEYLTRIHSLQLNGFVWDDEDMFQKFDERRPGHDMVRRAEWWEKTLRLRRNGGISTRLDGVYQFTFSANGNEDWGFGADNRELGRLSGGTGFSSGGGRCIHSAITIQVFEDGLYLIRANPQAFELQVSRVDAGAAPALLNRIDSLQLLGSMYPSAPFDPTVAERNMEEVGPLRWRKTIQLAAGVYAANFALSRELFLDTMALGAWVASDTPGKLVGRAWHGKPNEPNVLFEALESGSYLFSYDGRSDVFSIEAASPTSTDPLRPVVAVDSLQLVGSFDPPLVAWDPTSPQNDMVRTGSAVFERDVFLSAGKTYTYKYSANHLPWLWTFADYELDGYGSDFLGRNPDPRHSTLRELKEYGQLTTHGNPPSLSITPDASGNYRFSVDLETGAYSVAAAPARALDAELM